jgi:putative DNA primase/helicase
MLHRVRVLSTSEPQKGWRLDEALIKVLTGGDEVPVRELHKPYFMLRRNSSWA